MKKCRFSLDLPVRRGRKTIECSLLNRRIWARRCFFCVLIKPLKENAGCIQQKGVSDGNQRMELSPARKRKPAELYSRNSDKAISFFKEINPSGLK